MSVIDILGPVMVGPSSSHTLGALRIARFAYKFIGGMPEDVHFILHGSFAESAMGHGTDKALLAGVLGMREDDENIKNACEIAKKVGVRYSIEYGDLGDVHPNTVLMEIKKGGKIYRIMGSSIGGGEIRIVRINDVDCNISWEYNTLVLVMKDIPGALAHILKTITKNITNLYMRRVNALEGKAITIIETDEVIPKKDLKNVADCEYVYELFYIRRD